jgi:hypothetical protein
LVFGLAAAVLAAGKAVRALAAAVWCARHTGRYCSVTQNHFLDPLPTIHITRLRPRPSPYNNQANLNQGSAPFLGFFAFLHPENLFFSSFFGK